MLPIPMIREMMKVDLIRPSLRLSSKVRMEISKKVNNEEITANTIARKKQIPIRRPPGNLLKISVITRKIRLGPLCISTPPANADGMITKPARMAAAVSQMDTRMASLFRLFFLWNIAQIPHIIRKRKSTGMMILVTFSTRFVIPNSSNTDTNTSKTIAQMIGSAAEVVKSVKYASLSEPNLPFTIY